MHVVFAFTNDNIIKWKWRNIYSTAVNLQRIWKILKAKHLGFTTDNWMLPTFYSGISLHYPGCTPKYLIPGVG